MERIAAARAELERERPELAEAMDLRRDQLRWEASTRRLSLLEQAAVPPEAWARARRAAERLEAIQVRGGVRGGARRPRARTLSFSRCICLHVRAWVIGREKGGGVGRRGTHTPGRAAAPRAPPKGLPFSSTSTHHTRANLWFEGVVPLAGTQAGGGVSPADIHNAFQRLTWDASAEAKAFRASAAAAGGAAALGASGPKLKR